MSYFYRTLTVLSLASMGASAPALSDLSRLCPKNITAGQLSVLNGLGFARFNINGKEVRFRLEGPMDKKVLNPFGAHKEFAERSESLQFESAALRNLDKERLVCSYVHQDGSGRLEIAR